MITLHQPSLAIHEWKRLSVMGLQLIAIIITIITISNFHSLLQLFRSYQCLSVPCVTRMTSDTTSHRRDAYREALWGPSGIRGPADAVFFCRNHEDIPPLL